MTTTENATWHVVTKIPPDGDAGNLAVIVGLAVDKGEGNTVPILDMGAEGLGLFLALRKPVFTLGEVLLLGSDGRELTGRGRKPSKWSIETTECDTIDEAVTLARSVGGW